MFAMGEAHGETVVQDSALRLVLRNFICKSLGVLFSDLDLMGAQKT